MTRRNFLKEGNPVSSESSHVDVDELSYMYMYMCLHVYVAG